MASQNNSHSQTGLDLTAMSGSLPTKPGCPVLHTRVSPTRQASKGSSRNLGPNNDGYFDNQSMSQRLFADPSSKLGGAAGILLQSLNPMMMRVFSGTSDYTSDVAGRSERTGRYIDTVIFGDRLHADAAAESVRRLHAHSVWVDPHTGEELRADNEEWLAWTHNTLMYGVLRAADTFGPALTSDEQAQFLVEQRIAARLVGIEDDSLLPTAREELFAYIDANKHQMALTLPAAKVTRGLRKPVLRGNPVSVLLAVSVQDGILSLLPDWALLLFGVEGRPMNFRAAARTTRGVIASARKRKSSNELITEVAERVTTHPYRRVRNS